MYTLQVFIQKIDYLVYTIPSALIVLLVKEWSRYYFFTVTSAPNQKQTTSSNFLSSIDPLAFFCLSLTNISWGGMLQKNRKNHLSIFLISQLALLILIFIVMIYMYMKKPVETTYLYLFCSSIIKQSWLVIILNFLPIPPFDMSLVYIEKPEFEKLYLISKVLVLVFLVSGIVNVNHIIPGFLLFFIYLQ